MKKLKLLLTAILVSFIASSQAGQINQINIVNFTVKNTLPASVDSWLSTPGALVLTAQKVPGTQVREPMMVLQIKSGSAIICGNSMASPKRVDPFDVRVFNTADLLGLLGNCNELKAGTYTICVQFFNIDKVAISREVCKDFRVEDTNVEYSPPTLITPDNGKKFTAQELQGPVMFRWTPLVPKPKEPVTYRLRVWQLMQGQNGTMAMRTNQPIVTKDVDNITQATVSGIYTGPCRPPYICEYIWQVQALNRSGKPMGNNNGNSEPYTFGVKEENIKCPTNTFPEDKKSFSSEQAKQAITFKWTKIETPGASSSYRLKVWQLMQGQSGSQAMKTNQPIVMKDVDNITEATVSGIYTGPCRPPYLCDYVWALEMRNSAGQTTCTSEPTTFNVKEESIKCPVNTFPEDKKKFTSDVASKDMQFRWTPVVPKPQQPVTYRLKVWQLMQGQNGSAAMRTNPPIVTKDVADITQVSVSGIYTGPCRPPYLCDFVWAIETRTAAGQTTCTSEPTTFSVTEENAKCPTNTFPEDKKKITSDEASKEMLFRWTPVVPKPQQPVTYRLRVWQLMQGQNASAAMRTNPPIVTKDVADITQATVSGIYTGPCRPPYLCDYVWAVGIKNAAGQTICTSEPTLFSVTEENVKCPSNLFPENNKRINSEEAKRPITFKWTKSETPGTSSAYRLKVWQLMQGQSGSQAMRTNKPIVTKDVADITEATVSGIYTGPCRPPYLCDYVWAVEKISATGQVTCASEPTMFFVTQYIIQLDSIKISCTATPGVYTFKYCITNPNPGTAKLITLTATSSVPAGATIGTFSPPLNTNIASNGQLCITGTINAATNLSNICIGAAIQDVANNFWQAQKDTCVKVEPCKCEDCDEKHFTMNAPKPQQISYNNNLLSFNQSINVTTTPPKPIKSIKAELVYFEMVPENNMCIPCNKDAATYGHFTNGTNSDLWIGSQSSLNINITTPQLTPCCSAIFKWCIRYKIEFKDCTTCNVLICYEKKKDGCEKTGGGDNNGLPK